MNIIIIIICILNILGVICFILNHITKDPYAKQHKVTVEHARTNQEIKKGLMFRKDKLKQDHGMLFHTGKKLNSFWMKNTYIPLDVLFLDDNFRVIGMVENNLPLSLKSISINKPSSYVLEMNGGWIEKNNIHIGDTISI